MAAILAAGALVMPLLTSSPAQADPRQHTNQVVGVGSDTVQEVMNAFAGESNGLYYTPLASNAAGGRLQISSWNALAPGGNDNSISCLTPRAGANAFQRPNGSGQGRAALSRTFDLANFNVSTATGDYLACANKPTSGIVDFARSSSLGGAGTQLTYIPFGKDALDYAYYAVNGATANTALTQAQLQAIFTENTGGHGTTVNGLLVVPCDIQNGSGTQKDWPGKVGGGATAATITTASADCTASAPAGTLEENKPDQLKAKGDSWAAAHPGTPAMVIIGHSVSSFIAQSNNVAPNHLATGVGLGSIGGNAPFTGTAPNLAAGSAYYGSSFGRLVYTVWLTDTIGTGSVGNNNIKEVFRGSTSKVCSAHSTITAFGFLELPAGPDNVATNCGSVAQQGGLQANP